jgi:hypothetical protein
VPVTRVTLFSSEGQRIEPFERGVLMDSRPYQRRITGELAIDPALHELVMCTGALLDRLLCGPSSPIPVELPALHLAVTAAGGGEAGGASPSDGLPGPAGGMRPHRV